MGCGGGGICGVVMVKLLHGKGNDFYSGSGAIIARCGRHMWSSNDAVAAVILMVLLMVREDIAIQQTLVTFDMCFTALVSSPLTLAIHEGFKGPHRQFLHYT